MKQKHHPGFRPGCLFLNSVTPTLTKAETQSLSQNHTCVSGVDVTFGKIRGWWNLIGLLIHFGARRNQSCVWKGRWRTTDVVTLLRPRLDDHHVFPKAVSVGFALHHTRRHIRKGTTRARLAPDVFGLGSFLADAPADRAHRVRDAGIVCLKRTRQASALAVGQGSTMSFLNHWQFAGFPTRVAPLYAVLVLGKGPVWARAALS